MADAPTPPGRADRRAHHHSDDSPDCWIAITDGVLPTDEVVTWATTPRCGAVVAFVGTVRDHADGRDDVVALEYEAYEEPALKSMQAIADEARRLWPQLGRIALHHRVGRLAVGDRAVLVVVSTPHRAEAFDTAEWAIDTLKQAVPIWKKEQWADGSGWGTDAVPISGVRAV
jgi:molybdopterin synthase catalytic subunit